MAQDPAGTNRLRPVYAAGLAWSVLVALLAFIEPSFLRSLETSLLDLRFAVRGPVASTRQVAIVTVDDASLNRLGKWPWRRSVFADLVDVLGRAGAKVIAFDIFFQPDDRETQAEDSKRLATAIKQHGNVVLPVYFNLSRDAVSGVAAEEPAGLGFPIVRNADPLDHASMVTGFELNANEGLIQGAAAGAGHINLVPDPDGTTRREVLVLRYHDRFIPSLSVRAVQRFSAPSSDRLELVGGQGLTCGDRQVAIEPLPLGKALLWGTRVINYRGDYRSFDYFSAADVVAERFPTDAFRNKIVLIGATSPGLYDAISTPFSSLFPGVEKNANAIDNILANDFISRPPAYDLINLGLCLTLGLGLTLLLPHLSVLAQGVTLASAIALTAGVAQALFALQALWLPLAAPLATIVVVSLVVLLALFLKTRREHEAVVAERFETIVELGLSYQQKGLLEMAYQHFAKLPLTDDSCRLLYNLALELQRKRKNDLTITILKKLYAADRAYEDVAIRLKALGVEVVAPAQAADRQGTVTFVESQTTGDEGALLSPGQTLGRYEIQKLLGRGNMGAVYLARDPTIDRLVAIKTIHLTRFAEADELTELKALFLNEARMAGRLNHPNIVTIFDAGEDWDLSYIAMEVLAGVELKVYCQPGRLLTQAQVIGLTRTLAVALDYAHSHGVVHRDVKPANIMVLTGGQIKLTDFGIALIRGEMARIAGTPSYMAPEQLAGGPIDGRTDLYALGVVCFELLTGRKPFVNPDMGQLKQEILSRPAPRLATLVPGLTPGLDAIVARLLAKRPEERFASGRELAENLALLKPVANAAKPASTAKPAPTAATVDEATALERTAVLGAASDDKPPAG